MPETKWAMLLHLSGHITSSSEGSSVKSSPIMLLPASCVRQRIKSTSPVYSQMMAMSFIRVSASTTNPHPPPRATSWFQLFNLYVSFHFNCSLHSVSHQAILLSITLSWPLESSSSENWTFKHWYFSGKGDTWFSPRLLSIAREACHVAKIIQKPGHPNYKDPVIYEIGEKFPTKTIWP